MHHLARKTRLLHIWLGCLPALLAIVAYTISTEHYESVRATFVTDNFVSTLDSLLSSVKDAETGQRGYLLTGRESYLVPYEKALAGIDGQLRLTEQQAVDNAVPPEEVRRLRDLVKAKMKELTVTVELRRSQGLDAALQVVETGRGQRYMDQLRDLAARIGSRQHATLASRLEHQRHEQSMLDWVLGIGVGSGLLTLFLVVRAGELYTRERDRAETEIRRVNETLELRVKQRTAELQRSNDDLLQFAYVASHDLQEPLRTIGSYIGLISRRYSSQLDESAQTYMRFAIDGAARMQTLINDLLQYSRAGTQALARESVSAEELVRAALRNLETSIREKGASVRYSDLPITYADATKLTQVFQNLIGNAIKFHRPGVPPQVTISASRESDGWVFAVSDNGVGFEEKYTDRIFQVFQRLHGIGKYPGNGIGLAISRRIVEHHGGRLWATSKPGEGSTFFFSIPFGPLHPPAAPAASVEARRSAAKKVISNV